MTLYENIKARRLALKLSQEDLARKLGYKSTSTIAKIEAGKIDIPQSKIKAFADALGTTPSALMGWDEDESDVNKIGGYTIVYPGGEFCTTPGADHIDWVLHNGTEHYYIDPETSLLAQELKDNPQYRALLDSSKKLKPEGVKEVMNFINYQLQKEKGELDE